MAKLQLEATINLVQAKFLKLNDLQFETHRLNFIALMYSNALPYFKN